MIAASMTQVNSSVAHSKRTKCPIRGSAKVGENSCPKAVTRVRKSSPKPTMTNQCAPPTQVHCSIRVCPSDSLSRFTDRASGASARLTGWPTLTTAIMSRIALTNSVVPTAAMDSEITIATTCVNVSMRGSPRPRCASGQAASAPRA